MKFHIKKVLNIHNFENSTMDKFISTMFNVHSDNPSYVFELPGKTAHRLVFRRSDFSSAIYPNVTNVNKFQKKSNHRNLQASSSNRRPVKVKSEETSAEIRREKYLFEVGFDDHDESMRKIVEENVRSERDFVSFLNDLNTNIEQEYRERHQQKQEAVSKEEEDNWAEIGLIGWQGSMVNSKDELPQK